MFIYLFCVDLDTYLSDNIRILDNRKYFEAQGLSIPKRCRECRKARSQVLLQVCVTIMICKCSYVAYVIVYAVLHLYIQLVYKCLFLPENI